MSGRRGMVPQMLVSILAGKSDDNIKSVMQELQRAKVKSIAVGVGSMINQDELRMIADDGQNVIVNSDLSKLETSIPEIVRKINAGSFSLLQS
jgi:methylmalonyl-CoA mutase cobalamin-binding subunit